jgi:hypothetical protein
MFSVTQSAIIVDPLTQRSTETHVPANEAPVIPTLEKKQPKKNPSTPKQKQQRQNKTNEQVIVEDAMRKQSTVWLNSVDVPHTTSSTLPATSNLSMIGMLQKSFNFFY